MLLSFPLTFKHFCSYIFKLFIFYCSSASIPSILFPVFNLASILNFSFLYSLNEEPSFSGLLMQYVNYHDVEKCSFLKNDSVWFKKLTLAINYLFLYFNDFNGNTSIIMDSFHLFLIFSLYVYVFQFF